MSHDFKPEPHEKAMIDVMLKGNTTPKWVYEFNKFLIDERTTGEIIKFIDELLHQELQKAQEEAIAREKQLKQVHMMELDAISCMSLEQYVDWRDQRKQRPNQSELDQTNK